MNTFKKILIGFGIVWGIVSFFLIAYTESMPVDVVIQPAEWEHWLPVAVFCPGAAIIGIGSFIIGAHEERSKKRKA